ncbi:DUF6049 family protein [Alloscardovia macacae]|uniref:Uncharacterized protein n=1 Tax=Alloscardovia macacae TaxID=1160091 RepID=A0A261F6G5_9BIFI|nr:DUF6049 family protein [Alloscardovia macacae]OZG54720.1 hypothetical protein ALMA_0045 [Alloscardovia macacae]
MSFSSTFSRYARAACALAVLAGATFAFSLQPLPAALAASASPLTVDSSTSVITPSSGYDATFTVTNTSRTDLTDGTLTLSMNPWYEFQTSDDLQAWADGHLRLRGLTTFTQADVPALKAGASTQVKVHLNADDSALTSLTSWGAKPLLVTYEDNDSTQTQTLRTFVTRSNEGTASEGLPQLKFVLTLPASTGTIAACVTGKDQTTAAHTSMETLLSGSTEITATHTTPECASSTVSALKKLAASHPNVEVLTAPELSSQVSSAHSLQPYATDIATLAETAQAQDIIQTSAHAGANAVAMDGHSGWTTKALESAHSLGYTTVLANEGYGAAASESPLHNSVTHVSVQGTDMTVLTAQKELSTLAQGQATSEDATAEKTDAGIRNRFLAQTALFETQAPYEDRTVLINTATLSTDLTAEKVEAVGELADELNAAPWATLTSLNALETAQSSTDSADAEEYARTVSSANKNAVQAVSGIAEQINATHARMSSFLNSIISSSQAENADRKTRNPQDLARGKADQSRALSEDDFQKWRGTVEGLASNAAEQAFSARAISTYQSASSTQNASGLDALNAQAAVASDLFSAVSMSAPQSLNVVSETADVPVTLSNNLPVGLTLNVVTAAASDTIRSEVTLAGKQNVEVAAHSEQQVMLPVRALSGWTTQFKLHLTTPEGVAVTSEKSITISSSITILDNAGYAIFGLAIVLAVVGAKRQIARIRSGEPAEGNEE